VNHAKNSFPLMIVMALLCYGREPPIVLRSVFHLPQLLEFVITTAVNQFVTPIKRCILLVTRKGRNVNLFAILNLVVLPTNFTKENVGCFKEELRLSELTMYLKNTHATEKKIIVEVKEVDIMVVREVKEEDIMVQVDIMVVREVKEEDIMVHLKLVMVTMAVTMLVNTILREVKEVKAVDTMLVDTMMVDTILREAKITEEEVMVEEVMVEEATEVEAMVVTEVEVMVVTEEEAMVATEEEVMAVTEEEVMVEEFFHI